MTSMRPLPLIAAWSVAVVGALFALIYTVGLSLEHDLVRLLAILVGLVLTSLADPMRFYGLKRQPRWQSQRQRR